MTVHIFIWGPYHLTFVDTVSATLKWALASGLYPRPSHINPPLPNSILW